MLFLNILNIKIEDNEALNGAYIRWFAVSATAAVGSWLIWTSEWGLWYPLAVLLTGEAAKSVYNSGENVWNSVKNRSETISTVASDPQRFNELVEELSKINKGMKKHYGIQDTLGWLDKGVEIYKSKGILRLDARGGNEGFLYKDVNGKYNIVYIGNRMKEERQLNSGYLLGELLYWPEVHAYKPVFRIEGDSLVSVLNGFKEVTENTTDLEKLSKFSDVVYKQEIEAMESAMKSANVKPYK